MIGEVVRRRGFVAVGGDVAALVPQVRRQDFQVIPRTAGQDLDHRVMRLHAEELERQDRVPCPVARDIGRRAVRRRRRLRQVIGSRGRRKREYEQGCKQSFHGPLARQGFQDAVASGDAAQVRVAHPGEDRERRGVEGGEGLLELLHGPLQPADQELDALARALDGDGLVVELAGGVAVRDALLLEQLADQCAVVRFVGLHLAQDFPGVAVARMVVHEDHQRLGAGALGLEHPIEEIGHGYLNRLRAPSMTVLAPAFTAPTAREATLVAPPATEPHTAFTTSSADAPFERLPTSRRCTLGTGRPSVSPNCTLASRTEVWSMMNLRPEPEPAPLLAPSFTTWASMCCWMAVRLSPPAPGS